VRARLQIRRGELAAAEQWARKRGPSVTDDLSYLREYEHVTLARLLLARHQVARNSEALDEATGLLHRLLAAAEEGTRAGTVVEVLVLLALARQAQGDMPAALAALRRAMTLGQPEGYVRVFADEGPPMARLLKRLGKEAPVIAEYARRLVAATVRTDHPVPVAQTGLIEPLSDRELDVLRLLATDLGGPDIARRLHVSLNTMRTHSRNIFRKLQVNDRRAAVRQAVELDLLPPR
jgi:LuxR family transcriptional regulator, maltose regulon positive regulatory protein